MLDELDARSDRTLPPDHRTSATPTTLCCSRHEWEASAVSGPSAVHLFEGWGRRRCLRPGDRRKVVRCHPSPGGSLSLSQQQLHPLLSDFGQWFVPGLDAPAWAAGSGSICIRLTGLLSIRTSKCVCGPVEFPVEPTSPISWPRFTRSPSLTPIASR